MMRNFIVPSERSHETKADELEVSYLKLSKIFEHGNLEEYFQGLHLQKKKKQLSAVDFEKIILIYAKKIVQLFVSLNQKDIWYSDLKPRNVLLTQEKDIVINDIKGLIISPAKMVPSTRIITTSSYFQSNVFTKSLTNLEFLQRQTLATTLYELACGQLPEQTHCNEDQWTNNFDFNQAIFKGTLRVFLKDLIINLNTPMRLSMKALLNTLSEKLLSYDDIENNIVVDNPLVNLPSTKKPGAYLG